MISSIIAHFAEKVKSLSLSLSLSRNGVKVRQCQASLTSFFSRLRQCQSSLISFLNGLRSGSPVGFSRQQRLGLQSVSKRHEAGLTVRGFTIVELLIVVVVIAILATIMIVSYNGITSQARESARKSDIAAWKKQSEIYKIEHDITCPENWVFVYGNPQIPGSKDFCVMKYEAKVQGQDNGNQPYNPTFVAESRSSGTPWVGLTQAQALSEAAQLGDDIHLITNTEWMTLAADVLSVKYNWSGGTIGSGFIYSGHNDNFPDAALAASSDDEDGYTGTGNQAPSNQRRTLYLKSGDAIWDMAGDVYERVNATITGAQPGVPGDSADIAVFAWKEWSDPQMVWNNLPAADRSSALAAIPELSLINTWSRDQGVGALYSNKNDTSEHVFLRGGRWVNGNGAGVLTLNLLHTSLSTDKYIGFRAAR